MRWKNSAWRSTRISFLDSRVFLFFERPATTRGGFDQIDAALHQARRGAQVPTLHHRLHTLLPKPDPKREALLILEGDERVSQRPWPLLPGTNVNPSILDRRNRRQLHHQLVLIERNVRIRFATLLGPLGCQSVDRDSLDRVGAVPHLSLSSGKLVAQDLVNFTENDAWSWTLGTVDSGIINQYGFTDFLGSDPPRGGVRRRLDDRHVPDFLYFRRHRFLFFSLL